MGPCLLCDDEGLVKNLGKMFLNFALIKRRVS